MLRTATPRTLLTLLRGAGVHKAGLGAETHPSLTQQQKRRKPSRPSSRVALLNGTTPAHRHERTCVDRLKGAATIIAMLHLAPWTQVLVAATCCFLVGGLWFSPLMFGNRWVQELDAGDRAESRVAGALLAVPAALATAVALGVLIRSTDVHSLGMGVVIGLLVWGAFAVAIHLPAFYLEHAPVRTAIDVGHKPIVYVLIGAIIGGWH